MDRLYQFGITLIQWLQTFSPGLDGLMKAATFLGTVEFYIIFIPAIFWCVDQATGLRVLFILILTDVPASYFKQLLHQPRPYWIGGVEALSAETSYGIPSSHASNTLAVWGLIGTRMKKSWMWVFIVILLLLIGLSRLYLGVHFPQDVLGGWLIGLISLLLFLRYEKRVLDWWAKKTMTAQILLGFIFSALIILGGSLVLWAISGNPDPPEWAGFAAEARDPSHYFTLGGFLFGAVTGTTLMQKYARFSIEGAALARVARYAAGMIGLFAIYLGLDLLFGLLAEDASVLGYILRYIRYASIGLWAGFGAPWMFLKTGLAKRQ
jgi:membrane-associated phospholipid phosphatase